MTEMTEVAEPEISERSKVESWRLHVLIEAGYPLGLAERHPDWEILALDNLRRRGSEHNVGRLREGGGSLSSIRTRRSKSSGRRDRHP